MASHIADLQNMVIANGGSTSNAITLFDDASALFIYSPVTLTNTITVETEPSSTGTQFVVLQSGGVDVTIPAGKLTVLNKVGWRQMRLTSGGAEGQEDIFRVTKAFLT